MGRFSDNDTPVDVAPNASPVPVAPARGRFSAADTAVEPDPPRTADVPRSNFPAVLQPFRRAMQVTGEEFRAGNEQVNAGFARTVPDAPMPFPWQSGWAGQVASRMAGVPESLLGAVRAAGAPITGAATGFVGDPIRANIPGTAGQVAGTLAEDMAAIFGPGAFAEAGKAAGALGRRVFDRATLPQDPAGKAAEMVRRALGESSMTAEDALDAVKAGGGKPLTVRDVGGFGAERLGGATIRRGGEPATRAVTMLEKRDAEAGKRMLDDVSSMAGTTTGKEAIAALAEKRSAASKPLADAAYAGGSTAPLERQFEVAFDRYTKQLKGLENELNAIRQERLHPLMHDQTMTPTAAEDYLKGIDAREADVQKRLANVQREVADARSALGQAQTDRANGVKGAIWSPRLALLLKQPEVQAGIRQGLRKAQLEAAAKGETFNPHEFTVMGYDAEGEPIIGKVPNTRLLHAAKRALGDRLPNLRDPITGRLTDEGRVVDQARRAIRDELVNANSDYKQLMEVWAGDTESINAVDFGRKMLSRKMTVEDALDEIKTMTPPEREFAKLGVADRIRNDILNVGMNGDEAKVIFNSQAMREKMRPLFANEADYDRYLKSVLDERAMFNTKLRDVGNSATAGRQAADVEYFGREPGKVEQAAGAAADAASRGRLGLAKSALEWLRKAKDRTLRNDPQLTDALVRLLYDPDVKIEQFYPAGGGRTLSPEEVLRQIVRRPPASPRAAAVGAAAMGGSQADEHR